MFVILEDEGYDVHGRDIYAQGVYEVGPNDFVGAIAIYFKNCSIDSLVF